MQDIIRIPFNDVFFYGVSMRDREDLAVESDIFSNIIMRYLRTLLPVTNRLYRTAGESRYEYSYSFIPTRPLSWRVIKNKRVIEDIEQLSDGKYCLSYYDDQGNDVKRVIFGKGHKWLKTNYYNSIYGNSLLCSVLPKELNGETVILQYLTGATYPVTHYCCKKASCKDVEEKVFERAPLPEISALTNYGVLYFATEETLRIYNQVLEEEEVKYAEEHKPPVYTTDEDIASGFCFSEDSFESGRSVFSLDEANELTDDDTLLFADKPSALTETPEISELLTDSEVETSATQTEPENLEDKPFNIEDDISAVLEIIKNTTNVEIDSSVLFTKSDEGASEDELEKIFADTDVTSSKEETVSEPLTDDASVENADDSLVSELVSETEPENNEVKDFVLELNSPDAEPDGLIASQATDVDLLAMEDEEIDDYVKTLIDSLLSDAKSATGEYLNSSDEGFETEEETEPSKAPQVTLVDTTSLADADGVIESGNEIYYYFGDYSKESGRNGRGRTLMSDGKTAFEGEYKNDMRHGVGAFYYRSGDLCYFGNWSENKRSGFGMGINSDTGISHTGNWADNKPNGIGVRFDKFGNFIYLDSHSERVNGGIRVTGFTEKSLKFEYWDEKTLSIIKKEIFIDDIV